MSEKGTAVPEKHGFLENVLSMVRGALGLIGKDIGVGVTELRDEAGNLKSLGLEALDTVEKDLGLNAAQQPAEVGQPAQTENANSAAAKPAAAASGDVSGLGADEAKKQGIE